MGISGRIYQHCNEPSGFTKELWSTDVFRFGGSKLKIETVVDRAEVQDVCKLFT
jgi:hypothetical protein